MLVRKFHFCSVEVKVNLFRAYCTPLYTAPLWVNYKSESLRKLKVAYNDALRILLKEPRGGSASQLFCINGLTTFQALLRNLMHSFKCRLDGSLNEVIMVLVNPRYSSVRYHSHLWKHWYKCLLWLLAVWGFAPRPVRGYAQCKLHHLLTFYSVPLEGLSPTVSHAYTACKGHLLYILRMSWWWTCFYLF